MTRQIVKNTWDKAHPDPICRGWKKLIRQGYVSYTWKVSDSLQERDYQIFMGVWEHIDYCPFCALPINRGNPLYIQKDEIKDKVKAIHAMKRDVE